MRSGGKVNVYEQIVAEMKNLIELGVLPYGERLPSVRVYAVERKVNPNTVAKAYTQLEEDGYIRVQPKKGAYVCYGEGKGDSARLYELEKQISAYKAAGVKQEELWRIVEMVYGAEEEEER